MSTHTEPLAEPPRRGYTPEELSRALERSKGRLQAMEYACFGLANTSGKEAGCLVWILVDVLTDLERIEVTLEDLILIPDGSKSIPFA